MEYLSWTITVERQRYEWMRFRRSLVALRLTFLAVGHLAYFSICAIGHWLGTFQNYGLSIFVGFWSLILIGMTLLILEMVYAHLCPSTPPRYTIRNSGITLYGEDGPAAHFAWTHAPVLHLESDPAHPEFRSLVLRTHAHRLLRHFSRVIIPIPPGEAEDGQQYETRIVSALAQALDDNGLTWTPCPDGAVCVVRRTPSASVPLPNEVQRAVA
jgi:hypothetical protein